MSSMMSSQGVVLATAMAVSGTVILLALRLQKSLPHTQFTAREISQSSRPILKSCISSDGKKSEKKKKKKRVHFAEDVMDSCKDGQEWRQQRMNKISSYSNSESKVQKDYNDTRGMPANRVALYNGILRDRVAQRLAYSY